VKRKAAERREVTEAESKQIVAAYKAGTPVLDIAGKHDRSKSTVISVVQRSGVSLRGRGWRSRNMTGKGAAGKKKLRPGTLSEKERACIAADYAAGLLQADLVEKYGRSPDAIRHAAELAGVPLRGRGHKGAVAPAPKTDGTTKKKKWSASAAVAESIDHANKALASAHGKSGDVAKAVGVLIRSLAHEDIKNLYVDFEDRTFKMTRTHVEEGRAT